VARCARALIAGGVLALAASPRGAWAQAGPPFLTNDPGTPGNANWEINLASMQSIVRGASSYQVPQIDLNFGVGDRVQLTYEVPYILETAGGAPEHSGWGNAQPGVKWRFLDAGGHGWQASIFPQVVTRASRAAEEEGIAGPGPRYFVPVELSRQLGFLDVDVEAGFYLPKNGPRERIFGFAAGRPVTDRLELDAEIYDDRAADALPHATTLDIGGRYRLRPGLIALFMSGRSLNGFAHGQPEYMGYFGIQILLSDYGRRFTADP
jgi:hypothetical protein